MSQGTEIVLLHQEFSHQLRSKLDLIRQFELFCQLQAYLEVIDSVSVDRNGVHQLYRRGRTTAVELIDGSVITV